MKQFVKQFFTLVVIMIIGISNAYANAAVAAIIMAQNNDDENSAGTKISGPIKKLYSIEYSAHDRAYHVITNTDRNRCFDCATDQPLLEGFTCPNKQHTLILFNGYAHPETIVCQ